MEHVLDLTLGLSKTKSRDFIQRTLLPALNSKQRRSEGVDMLPALRELVFGSEEDGEEDEEDEGEEQEETAGEGEGEGKEIEKDPSERPSGRRRRRTSLPPGLHRTAAETLLKAIGGLVKKQQ